MNPTPTYPGGIWDGSSRSRDHFNTFEAPDGHDWLRITREIQEMQRELLNPSVQAANVSRSTTQSISSATPTAMIFDTIQRIDGDALWVVGTPTRFTATKTGWYFGAAFIHWAGATGFGRRCIIRLNGTTTIARASVFADADHNDPSFSVPWAYYMTLGDYVEYLADQNSGSPLNVQANARGWIMRR